MTRFAKPLALSALALLLLNGCTVNQIVPGEPPSKKIAMKCHADEDEQAGYHTAIPEVRAGVVTPPDAKDEGVNGCAAVKFQIDDEGKAYNITLLREMPPNYGFGDAVSDKVRRSTYKAPAHKDMWFFENTALMVRPN